MRVTPGGRALLLAAALAGCATVPEAPPLSGDREMDAFARRIETALEGHAWQDVLAVADPDHFRTQVVEHGMGEPQYLAELLGLHGTGNDIGRGEEIGWDDLERIREVELESLAGSGGEHRLAGRATLDDGGMLRLEARITRVAGRLVLTGAVG